MHPLPSWNLLTAWLMLLHCISQSLEQSDVLAEAEINVISRETHKPQDSSEACVRTL